MKLNGLKVVGTGLAAVALLLAGALAGSTLERRAAGADLEPSSETIIWGEHTVDETGVVLDRASNEPEKADAESTTTGGEEVSLADYGRSSGEVQATPIPLVPTPVESVPTPVPPTPEPTQVATEPIPEATPEIEAPYVVTITPANGAIGVATDATIEVTFSEAMDEDSAQDAFHLTGSNCGSFASNSASTVMSFEPCTGWAYGTEVEVEIIDSATSALSTATLEGDFSSDFRVLRQTTRTLYSEPEYDGTVASWDAAYFPGVTVVDEAHISVSLGSRGFLSFDLRELPGDITAFQAANIGTYQTAHAPGAYGPTTGALLIESVTYGTLDWEDWDKPANSICAVICIGKGGNSRVLSSTFVDGWKSREMLVAVQRDWEHREARDY